MAAASEVELYKVLPEPEPDTLLTDFPMYALEREVVTRLLDEEGLRVAHVETDGRAAPEWVGYRYFATTK